MSAVDSLAPPPGAFLGTSSEEEKIDRDLAEIERVEGRKVRSRKWKGRAAWALFVAAVGANFAQSFVTATLLPLKEVQHRYTVLRDDGTSAVYRTTWDLPASKAEELIQATAVKYTERCESWSWAHARYDYDVCLALSRGVRHEQYKAYMDRKTNPKAPANTYGQEGWVRFFPAGVQRIGPNSIRVFFVLVDQERPGGPLRERRLKAVHDYVPVKELPADLKQFEPVADIQFVRTEISEDTSPMALNPELARQPSVAPQGETR